MLEPTQSEAQHLDTAQNIEPAITGILFLPVGVSVTTSDCRGTVGEEEEERARRPGYTAGEERTGFLTTKTQQHLQNTTTAEPDRPADC